MGEKHIGAFWKTPEVGADSADDGREHLWFGQAPARLLDSWCMAFDRVGAPKYSKAR